jgi:hypothetical protein
MVAADEIASTSEVNVPSSVAEPLGSVGASRGVVTALSLPSLAVEHPVQNRDRC